MKGTKRFALSGSASDTNDSEFRNKRIMAGSPFDAQRAEPSQQQSTATAPLDPKRAELSQQHVKALNTQFASWVQLQLKNHPDELWEDGVQDYLTHASNIMEKFSDVVNWLKGNAANGGSLSATESHEGESKVVPVNQNTETKLFQGKTRFTPISTTTGFSATTPSFSLGTTSTSPTPADMTKKFSPLGTTTSFTSSSSSFAPAGSNSIFSFGGTTRNFTSANTTTSFTSAGTTTSFTSAGTTTSFTSSSSTTSFAPAGSNSIFSFGGTTTNFTSANPTTSFTSASTTTSFTSAGTTTSFPSFGMTASSATPWSSGVFSNSQTSVLFGTQSSGALNNNASEDADDENELPQPSSPSVKKSEEKGVVVVHEVKCKLYVKSTDPADKDSWKDKGTGQLSIKCKEGISKGSKDSKPTIVVRNDVGKVLLNALLYPGIKTSAQKNSLVAIFHTSDDGGNNDNAVARTFLIRTRSEEDRNKLASAIQEYAPAS